MAGLPPIRAIWTGEALEPSGTHRRILAEHLGAGEVVTLDLEMTRSGASHNHQFAWVKTAWDNLPEYLEDQLWAKSPETLRKWALIRTGWCDVAQVDCGRAALAQDLQRMTAPSYEKAHGYAEVLVKGTVMTVVTPHSQSLRAMGKDAFQKSKTDILDCISTLLGVAPEKLGAET